MKHSLAVNIRTRHPLFYQNSVQSTHTQLLEEALKRISSVFVLGYDNINHV